MAEYGYFKSYVSGVQTAADFDNEMQEVLTHQYMFERKTHPNETPLWGEGKLQELQVDASRITRVYHIKSNSDAYGSEFYFLIRMDCMSRHAFVALSASCDYTGFDCQGGGEIFVTFSPKTFLSEAMQSIEDGDLLLQHLKEDGYEVEEENQSKQARLEEWCQLSSDMNELSLQATQFSLDD